MPRIPAYQTNINLPSPRAGADTGLKPVAEDAFTAPQRALGQLGEAVGQLGEAVYLRAKQHEAENKKTYSELAKNEVLKGQLELKKILADPSVKAVDKINAAKTYREQLSQRRDYTDVASIKDTDWDGFGKTVKKLRFSDNERQLFKSDIDLMDASFDAKMSQYEGEAMKLHQFIVKDEAFSSISEAINNGLQSFDFGIAAIEELYMEKDGTIKDYFVDELKKKEAMLATSYLQRKIDDRDMPVIQEILNGKYDKYFQSDKDMGKLDSLKNFAGKSLADSQVKGLVAEAMSMISEPLNPKEVERAQNEILKRPGLSEDVKDAFKIKLYTENNRQKEILTEQEVYERKRVVNATARALEEKDYKRATDIVSGSSLGDDEKIRMMDDIDKQGYAIKTDPGVFNKLLDDIPQKRAVMDDTDIDAYVIKRKLSTEDANRLKSFLNDYQGGEQTAAGADVRYKFGIALLRDKYDSGDFRRLLFQIDKKAAEIKKKKDKTKEDRAYIERQSQELYIQAVESYSDRAKKEPDNALDIVEELLNPVKRAKIKEQTIRYFDSINKGRPDTAISKSGKKLIRNPKSKTGWSVVED